MSDLMKRAHELAPFVAEALREVADEATFPDDTDERMWTLAQKESHQFAVDIAVELIAGSTDAVLEDAVQAHAEAARDAAMEE